MKQPLTLLVVCLLVVIAAVGYGTWERHVGVQQALARAHADSLLQASQRQQDSLRVADSVASQRAQVVRDSLSMRLRALQRDYGASRKHVDSAAISALRDSLVPRDTVAALVKGFQGALAQADSTISTLAADTLLLVGRIATKDSTIRALNTLLDGNRRQLAQALKPQSPGLFEKAGRLVELVLAVRGGIAFAVGR